MKEDKKKGRLPLHTELDNKNEIRLRLDSRDMNLEISRLDRKIVLARSAVIIEINQARTLKRSERLQIFDDLMSAEPIELVSKIETTLDELGHRRRRLYTVGLSPLIDELEKWRAALVKRDKLLTRRA